MKEFNLEEALAGKPVKLRSGEKAFVLKKLDNAAFINATLIGYVISSQGQYEHTLSWAESGMFYSDPSYTDPHDIISMWEDPPKTIKVGNIEFPEPEHKILGIGREYFYPSLGVGQYYSKAYWADNVADISRLNRGLIHLTQEAAIAHTKALIKISQGKID